MIEQFETQTRPVLCKASCLWQDRSAVHPDGRLGAAPTSTLQLFQKKTFYASSSTDHRRPRCRNCSREKTRGATSTSSPLSEGHNAPPTLLVSIKDRRAPTLLDRQNLDIKEIFC
jgi:hypothetical protein